MKITKTFEVTARHLEDFFCQVIESGASNYWMGWIEFFQSGHTVSYQKLDYSVAFSWTILDAETEVLYGPVFSNKIASAASSNNELVNYLEMLTDELGIDTSQADSLLQLLTFGEEVFVW